MSSPRSRDLYLRKIYESIVYQTELRTIHEVFSADVAGVVKIVVFNGIVDSIDPSSGIRAVNASFRFEWSEANSKPSISHPSIRRRAFES